MYRRLHHNRNKDYRGFVMLGSCLIGLVLVLSISIPLEAQNFPDRSVTLVVPFTAGAGADLAARAIQPYAEKPLGVSLMIENVPGADSRIGTARVYKANPNGYTIGIHGFPTPLIHEYLFDISYKPLEFSYIYAWAKSPMALFVSEGSWKDIDEFINEARKRPLSVGIAGFGSTSHLLALAMAKRTNIKLKFVPFSGSAEGFAALAGKHVDANIGSTSSGLGMIRGKLVRPILLWSSIPDLNFPDIPLSTKHDFPTIVFTWGVFGPPKMPADRIQALEKGFSAATAEPGLAEWVNGRGMYLVQLNSKKFREEVEKQQSLIKEYKDLLKAK